MNTITLFLFDVALLLGGYGFARLQLRGRFILAQEAIDDAEAEVATVRHRELCRTHALEQWKESIVQEFALTMTTDSCPEGISAKQVLGYRDLGALPHPPQYAGGLRAWDANHGIPEREDQ